jgi:C-terminal processing protease CtpA/Prc
MKTPIKNICVSLVITLGLLTLVPASHASEKGYLGLAIAVDGEGFFLNPTLKTVTVQKVTPNSPAARAGIEVGDQIMEIEGKKVIGAKANDLKPYMEREAGAQLRMVIKKASGELSQLSVVLAQRPQ